jgi:transposase
VDQIKRQVFDIKINRQVTEYQAEVYENELGERVTADFPEGVNAPVQYGNSIKSTAIYL